ncbi:MarR family transcriptional regulator [Neorhizobium galegae]|uniref:MarR family transcriptional regulator n=1 Tax=Neorhizobium galegae TaxID=399 RepID=A0A6A1TQ33_NEOGA|nr:helix-turn-helix domain-containing protein [Neorhizobium galegae]KAB1084059.1 MarR family transcriptional regulator [Neorhizobium galegae]
MKKLSRLRQVDYETLADLRYALRQFMDFSASAAQVEGLPPQQHQALLAIKGNRNGKPMTVGMLAERLLIAPHTATELINRLVDGGLAARQVDQEDRRRQTVQLTDKAEELLGRLSEAHIVEIREMTPKLVALLSQLEKMPLASADDE